jgi:histidyl-tRNA synthetase
MKLAARLRKSGISVEYRYSEYGYVENPTLEDQLRYAVVESILLVVIFGEDDIRKGTCRLKDMCDGSEIGV